MTTTLSKLVRSSNRRLALPIAVHPGLSLTGATVRDAVTDPAAQSKASLALQRRFGAQVVLSAMDLSVEAEAFGCQINLPQDEIPTVTASLVTTPEQGRDLVVPKIGTGRTDVYLDTVALLRKQSPQSVVLAGCIGPFSLASRLVGMSEACGLTIMDPDWMHCMVEKSTEFLINYAREFKHRGATGLIMAEPGAGLLSPKALAEFSSQYVRRIVNAVCDDSFELILHNCAAKLVHLPNILESGTSLFHFGAPMDIAAALAKTPKEVILLGNLDPSAVFVQMRPEEVAARTQALLSATSAYPNFVASSGCDVPPGASIANLDMFYQTATSA